MPPVTAPSGAMGTQVYHSRPSAFSTSLVTGLVPGSSPSRHRKVMFVVDRPSVPIVASALVASSRKAPHGEHGYADGAAESFVVPHAVRFEERHLAPHPKDAVHHEDDARPCEERQRELRDDSHAPAATASLDVGHCHELVDVRLEGDLDATVLRA